MLPRLVSRQLLFDWTSDHTAFRLSVALHKVRLLLATI